LLSSQALASPSWQVLLPGWQQEHHERNLASVAGQQQEFSYTVAGQQQHEPKLTSVAGQQHESNSTTDRLLDSNKKSCWTANQDTRTGALGAFCSSSGASKIS